MADWIQTHSFISCKNHGTAVQVYQALELHGENFNGGLRWGFWDLKTVLVSSTMRWGWDTTFIDELLNEFDILCIHENNSGEDSPIYEAQVREILGVKRDFLWSNQPEILARLLDDFEPFETGLTTLAICESDKAAKAFIMSEAADESVLRGFISDENRFFVLGKHEFSPLENPLISTRLSGSAWPITGELDGQTIMPTNPFSRDDLWKMDRHGGFGLFQTCEQRNALIQNALEDENLAEQHAGHAMARRWNTASFSKTDFQSLQTRKGSELGIQMLDWLNLDDAPSTEKLERARSLIGDEIFGPAVRRLLVFQEEINERDLQKIINASFDLFEISHLFLEKIEQPNIANAFVQRAAEIAYSINRCTYWKVRYGVDGPDHISPFDGSWNGDPTSKADRIGYWAAQIVQIKDIKREPKQQAIRTFVAMNELLHACRNNRVFWVPSIGILQGMLVRVLENKPTTDIFFWGTEEWIVFEKQNTQLIELYRESKIPEKRLELQGLSIEILAAVPDFLSIWQYCAFGRRGLRLLSWIANNLAWTLYEDGDLERAVFYGKSAFRGANWDQDAYRDTYTEILIAMGRKEEAFRIIYAGIGRGSEAFDAFSEREDYQHWAKNLEME